MAGNVPYRTVPCRAVPYRTVTYRTVPGKAWLLTRGVRFRRGIGHVDRHALHYVVLAAQRLRNLNTRREVSFISMEQQCTRTGSEFLVLWIKRLMAATSIVADSVPDLDSEVFGPSGSGSVSQRYGSGSRSFPFLLKVLSGLK